MATYIATREDGSRHEYQFHDITQVKAELQTLAETMPLIGSGKSFPPETLARMQDLQSIIDTDAQHERLRAAAMNPAACEGESEVVARGRAASEAERRSEHVRGVGPDARSRNLARSVVDSLHRKGRLADGPAELVDALLTGSDGSGQPAAAGESEALVKWVNTAGSEDYLAAFAKVMSDPRTGHTLFDSAEAAAWREARSYGIRNGLDTGNGSSMLPLVLDPAILLTNDGSAGGIRSVARTVQITGSSWNGVTSSGATAEWKAENAEAADGTPSVAGKEVPVHMLDVDALVSYELAQDAVNFAQELAQVIQDAATVKVDAALATGSGSGQPTGIVTAISAVTTSAVATGGTFDSADVVALQNALPARFQPNAQFVAPLPVINTIASFETTNGALRFPEVSEGRLLRRPLIEDSNISADMSTANSKFAAYGDWSQFLLVSRVGTTIEVLPAFGENGRPTAQRHYFLTMRLGSDALVPSAFRLLNKTAS